MSSTDDPKDPLPWGNQTIPISSDTPSYPDPNKCECGSHIKYGVDCAGWMHSRWCQLYLEDTQNEVHFDEKR